MLPPGEARAWVTENISQAPNTKKQVATPWAKDSKSQRFKASGIQGLKDSSIQGLKDSGIQGLTDGKTQWFMFGHLFQDSHTRLSRTQPLDPPQSKAYEDTCSTALERKHKSEQI